jgi:subtilisin family serine protease
VNGRKSRFEISSTKKLVKSEKFDFTGIKNAIPKAYASSLKDIYDLNDQLFLVDMQNTSKENLLEMLEQWKTSEGIVYTSPVFLDETGREIGGLINQVFVRLKSIIDYPFLEKSIKDYPIQTVNPCDFDERTFRLTLARDAKKDSMLIANELHETCLFEYAEPNLIHFPYLATNDKYFNQQWGLKNTGQSGGTSGIDIKAEQAWTITTGSPAIRIAILDTGVDLNHPDLVNNLLPGYDSTGYNGGGAPDVNSVAFTHGTQYAGIAAAQANNSIM